MPDETIASPDKTSPYYVVVKDVDGHFRYTICEAIITIDLPDDISRTTGLEINRYIEMHKVKAAPLPPGILVSLNRSGPHVRLLNSDDPGQQTSGV